MAAKTHAALALQTSEQIPPGAPSFSWIWLRAAHLVGVEGSADPQSPSALTPMA